MLKSFSNSFFFYITKKNKQILWIVVDRNDIQCNLFIQSSQQNKQILWIVVDRNDIQCNLFIQSSQQNVILKLVIILNRQSIPMKDRKILQGYSQLR